MNNPHDIAEQNIRAIYKREQKQLKKIPLTHKLANWIANFSGTVLFAGINAVFFVMWITLNLTGWKFDPYPFTFLTMMVSLESIFLSVFVLISQNELSAQTEARNNLDLQVNLLAEQESTAIINLLVKMAEKIGIPDADLEDIKKFADDTDPEEILEKIDKVQSETTQP